MITTVLFSAGRRNAERLLANPQSPFWRWLKTQSDVGKVALLIDNTYYPVASSVEPELLDEMADDSVLGSDFFAGCLVIQFRQAVLQSRVYELFAGYLELAGQDVRRGIIEVEVVEVRSQHNVLVLEIE